MRLLPPDLAERLPGPELMDDLDAIGGAELEETLAELRAINRWLGGYRTTWSALDDLASRVPLERPAGEPLTVLDVGGGSGDVAESIVSWGESRRIPVSVTLVELHPHTARVAGDRLRDTPAARAEVGDLFEIPEKSYDVVHAALFLHHFDGGDAARALVAMSGIARLGVVVNDLHRHWVPWTLIRWITGSFSRNRLIRHDAPLSVARAFTTDDWRALGRSTGLDLTWRRKWAWRWAVSGVPS